MIKAVLKDSTEVRLAIAKTGNSLRGFSKEVGMSHGYLSQILTAKRTPSLVMGHKIATGLNLEIEDIFFVGVVDENIQRGGERK